jgi:hypothetical protein
LEPGDQAELPDRTGLFAVPVDGGPILRQVDIGRAEGVSVLTVPTGSYVVSAETWSPALRRAGRLRVAIRERPAPEDVATVSDLLLLAPVAPEPTSVDEALHATLPRGRILPGQTVAIAWEVVGLGFRPEILSYEVSVERSGRSFFRRIGELVRLAEPPRPIGLAWEEPGPASPRPAFRYLELDLPELDAGDYEIRLVLRTADRSDAVVTTRLEVRDRSL